MRHQTIKAIILIALITTLISVFLYFVIQKDNACDEHVTLDDSTEYDCKSVSSFSNGMSTINLCDGGRISMPTNRIKMVTDINR